MYMLDSFYLQVTSVATGGVVRIRSRYARAFTILPLYHCSVVQ